jgi:hypothetical protein
LREWSFGFLIRKSNPLSKGRRELVNLEMKEISIVLAGAGHTETISVKSETAGSRDDLAIAREALAATMLAPYRAQLDLARRRSRLAHLR